MLDYSALSRPLRVYGFLNHLNEDLLAFLVDIAPEAHLPSNSYDCRTKLLEWKSRMSKLLRDRIAAEFGESVAVRFNMRMWVEALSKDFSEDALFVVSNRLIQQCLKDYNSSMNMVRDTIHKVLARSQ